MVDKLQAKALLKVQGVKARAEDGVALITLIVLTAVLMLFAGGMYYVATRESSMTFADKSSGQAFSYAEGGIENVLDIMNYAATEYQLTQLRADQSPDGFGYLMDPDPAKRQNPPNPVQMKIGNSSFTVFVDEVDSNGNHCVGCGLNLASKSPAYILITAQSQTKEGYRKLQQRVRLQASGYPLAFYVDGNATLNGNPQVQNQSIFVRGDFFGRGKLTVSGSDLAYGSGAAVLATGTIYDKQNGGSSQIYTSSGARSSYWNSNEINDRDSRGPTGNTYNLAAMENTFSSAGILPGGLTTNQLTTLKNQAINTGYYNGNPGNNLTIQQKDVPNRGGDLVVYIEFPSGNPQNNNVDLKFQWPPAGFTSGKMIVVIKNGSASIEGSTIGSSNGYIYCPDGSVTANGSGNGTYSGYIWAKGLTDIGNFNFSMNQQLLNDPPFFTWTATREMNWTLVDR